MALEFLLDGTAQQEGDASGAVILLHLGLRFAGLAWHPRCDSMEVSCGLSRSLGAARAAARVAAPSTPFLPPYYLLPRGRRIDLGSC